VSAYLIYSQDPNLGEFFLENKIAQFKPDNVFRYSLHKVKFKEIASKIFNFSLFGKRSLYFLENAEALKDQDLEFLRKIDFDQLTDTYIFHLQSKTYWLEVPKWEGIKGLKIQELRIGSKQLKDYLEKICNKKLTPSAINLLLQAYQKNPSLMELINALKQASLYYHQAQELDEKMVEPFLEEKEPAEMRYLVESIRKRDLAHALGIIFSLQENGYKGERILLSLISRLSKGADPEQAEFLINIDRSFKAGTRDTFFLLLKLLFYYCKPEVLEFS
jgi:DNA polymerase III delta subunit